MNAVIAIHQPNYFPWFGYFSKIANSDAFVFLDDAQFSKNSYINRTQVLLGDRKKWLTIPISYQFGDAIAAVHPARADWIDVHLHTLDNYYRMAPCFSDVRPEIGDILENATGANLAEINMEIIKYVAKKLDLTNEFYRASELNLPDASGDVQLAAIVHTLSPSGTYLSGKGGAAYQSKDAFENLGISLKYNEVTETGYSQSTKEFTQGLSVLDSIFVRGWAETAAAFR